MAPTATPATAVDAMGGFATSVQLHEAGVRRAAITEALGTGTLRRVRRGYYSTLAAQDPRYIAVRIGGRLTGLSAIEALGGWVWRRPRRIHVALAPGASRLRLRADDDVELHWKTDDEPGGSVDIVGVPAALIRVALDEPLEVAVACYDWALRSGLIDRIEWEGIFLRLPSSAAVIKQWTDPSSQSILETVSRVRCVSRGWKVRSQARVGDLQQIDLVIEDQIALELDGREFHESTFDSDRVKDLLFTIEGRHSIRLSTPIVRNSWADVERAIEAALAARRNGDSGNSASVPPVPRGTRRRPTRNLTKG